MSTTASGHLSRSLRRLLEFSYKLAAKQLCLHHLDNPAATPAAGSEWQSATPDSAGAGASATSMERATQWQSPAPDSAGAGASATTLEKKQHKPPRP